MVTWKVTRTVEPALHDRAAFIAERSLPADAATIDPLIAFREEAWAGMIAHVSPEQVEVGGMLLGEVFEDPSGRLALDVLHAIPALGARQEPTYFKLTDEAWSHICAMRDAIDPEMLIVGWYHSHPNLGAFYSGTDRASQRAFYNRPWNFGLVIDPHRDDMALFLGGDSERIPIESIARYKPEPAPVWVHVIDPPAPRLPDAEPPIDWRLDRTDAAAAAILGCLSTALLRRIWRVLR